MMNIDDMEGLDEAARKEIEELIKVTREKDGDKYFAKAQFIIGRNLAKQGATKKALEVWQGIKKIDDKEVFAITQNSIANMLQEQDKIKEALEAWYKIEREDYLDIYVVAQQSIGWALKVQGDIVGALEAWDNIKRKDNPEGYAAAQLMSGWALEDWGEITRALEAWYKVEKVDSPIWYPPAQLAIARVLNSQGDIKNALKTWHNIERKDDPESYVIAQQSIASTLKALGDFDGALVSWKNIKRIDNKKHYGKAQFAIARSLIDRNLEGDVEEAKSFFISASEFYPYETYCYIRICEMLISRENKTIGSSLLSFMKEVLNIMTVLTLDFGSFTGEEKPPERKLAHYTSIDTINKLLAEDKSTKVTSSFRLNTINNVNDPSEGQLLLNYLDFSEPSELYTSEFDEKLHAFISCFTFNHDSLNQFRLYGKKDNLEASGVSLVFDKDFFQSDISFEGMTFLAVQSNKKILTNEINHRECEEDINVEEDERVGKQPVMRCIYLDPVSRYIQLAQRNRLTFYREAEFYKDAEEEWIEYKKDVDRKTIEVKKSLQILVNLYQEIRYEYPEDFKNYSDFMDEIILPLKYLIKHSAFQEEQECRMVYITSLDDSKVQMDFGKFLYVEYEPEVKAHLDKIYIAPAATQYKPYLAKLLCDTNVKIELSNNPYRQT